MKKRTIVIFIVILAVGLAGLAIPMWKAGRKKKLEWVITHPQQKDLQLVVTATGTVNAVQTVQVGTQVSGVISKLFVDYNDRVTRGQVIAQLDIATLKANLDEAQANESKATAQLQQLKNEYERELFLWNKKVISKSDYDAALANFQAAKTALSAARAEVVKARTNLQYATIHAPINGVIVSRNVDVGQTVAASFATPTLFVIANDLTKMQVLANVDEADIGQVKVGQDVRFTVDAYRDLTFAGKVNQIRLQPNIVQNVVEYTVVIDAPNPELKLLPGMNTDVSIIVRKDVNVLTLPVAALKFRPPGQSARDSTAAQQQLDKLPGHSKALIYLLEAGKLRAVPIVTGLSDGVNTEIPGSTLAPTADVLTGTKEEVKAQNTKGLFQGPRPSGGSSIRNMR